MTTPAENGDLSGPSLIYVTTDGSRHWIDRDLWDPASLGGRELAMARALLALATEKLDAAYARALTRGPVPADPLASLAPWELDLLDQHRREREEGNR